MSDRFTELCDTFFNGRPAHPALIARLKDAEQTLREIADSAGHANGPLQTAARRAAGYFERYPEAV